MDPTIPRLKWPLEVASNGHFAVLEQDSIEEIEQCVVIVCSVERGEIEVMPDLGLRSRVLTKNSSAQVADLAAEVVTQEPRADTGMSVGPDRLERLINLTVGRAT